MTLARCMAFVCANSRPIYSDSSVGRETLPLGRLWNIHPVREVFDTGGAGCDRRDEAWVFSARGPRQNWCRPGNCPAVQY